MKAAGIVPSGLFFLTEMNLVAATGAREFAGWVFDLRIEERLADSASR